MKYFILITIVFFNLNSGFSQDSIVIQVLNIIDSLPYQDSFFYNSNKQQKWSDEQGKFKLVNNCNNDSLYFLIGSFDCESASYKVKCQDSIAIYFKCVEICPKKYRDFKTYEDSLLQKVNLNDYYSKSNKFKKDKKFKYFGWHHLLDTLKLKEPDFTQTLFQLRFWNIKWYLEPHELHCISLQKDSTWKIQQYKFDTWTFDTIQLRSSESKQLDIVWSKAWEEIKKYSFLNLKGQGKQKLYKDKEGCKWVTTDGDTYYFELISKKGKKRLTYSNPQTHFEIHEIISIEWYFILKILGILNEQITYAQGLEKK